MSIILASNGSALRRCRKAFSSSPGAVKGLIISGYSRGACDWFFSFPLLPLAPVCFVMAVEVVIADVAESVGMIVG